MPKVRPIDGNALLEELQEELDFDSPNLTDVANSAMKSAFRIAMKRVRKAPTLDVVPVVRCRECKHYREYERCSMSAVYRHCALHKGLAMITPDSFCSYGERREDNGQNTIGDSPRT